MTKVLEMDNMHFVKLSNDELMHIDGGVDWNEVGLTVTTASGAVIGAAIGAKIGAGIGTAAAPGIGTVVGGILGGAIGAIVYTLWD